MKICIDPGHSGSIEPGACACGLRECDVVLAASLELNAILLAAGHETLLTRETDIDTDDLFFRSYLANAWPADLFISLHANSADNTSARGMEAFHFPGSNSGTELAAAILTELAGAVDTANRGVKAANFQVLRETDATAVLVELAFLSNEQDRAVLADAAQLRTMAEAIASGCCNYARNYLTNDPESGKITTNEYSRDGV